MKKKLIKSITALMLGVIITLGISSNVVLASEQNSISGQQGKKGDPIDPPVPH